DRAALLPESVGQGSLVREDQREVCRLSPWDDVAGRLNPYPSPYRTAFACSLLLYPPSHRLRLRDRFPEGETTGLPRPPAVTVWVRSRLGAGGATTAPEEFGASGPDHVPVWPKPDSEAAVRRTRPVPFFGSIFGLSSLTALSSASPELTLPHDPGSRPR